MTCSEICLLFWRSVGRRKLINRRVGVENLATDLGNIQRVQNLECASFKCIGAVVKISVKT